MERGDWSDEGWGGGRIFIEIQVFEDPLFRVYLSQKNKSIQVKFSFDTFDNILIFRHNPLTN